MFYFTPFPVRDYQLKGKTAPQQITDITRRFTLQSFLQKGLITFDEYFVQDGEKPDDVAYDYYGDPTLDWLIFFANETKDPYFEWPRSDEQLHAYITQKYGSLSTAYQTVHHYEWIVQQESQYQTNFETIIIPEKTVTVDYAKYITLVATERKSISMVDYEENLNEYRRKIFLYDTNLVEQIKEQHPVVFEEGLFVR